MVMKEAKEKLHQKLVTSYDWQPNGFIWPKWAEKKRNDQQQQQQKSLGVCDTKNKLLTNTALSLSSSFYNNHHHDWH